MIMLKLTDNCQWIQIPNIDGLSELSADELGSVRSDLEKIADKSIGALTAKDNPNLLVFPRDLHHYGDEIGDNYILSMRGDKISTGNIMGFVGVNDSQVDIKTRFANDNQDYFLHYMLQKVFCVNLFDLKHSINENPVFDFLLYLFPYYLKKAVAQGLFKKYRKFEYNDAKVRGPINVSRHIKENIPFKGAIAYSTREHSYDNEITQLIRHTIEFIKTKKLGSVILNNDLDTIKCVSQIVLATNTYNVSERTKVINKNIRPVRHPYFSEYTDLQKICLQILRHESIKYGQEKDKVYGILFDGAWLWEEYLYTILKKDGFEHPKNKQMCGGFKMFDDKDEDFDKCSRRLYPDFYKNDFIVDAKYKHLENGVGREDLYQVVTYMYCKKAKNGAYLYPCKEELSHQQYKLTGYNGIIKVVPFFIPQNSFAAFNEFKNEIVDSENKTLDYIKSCQKTS